MRFLCILAACGAVLAAPARASLYDRFHGGSTYRAGFRRNLGAFGTVRGALDAHWLPRARGDDFEMRMHIRAGATAGAVPFDELFQLGVERDNDLWCAHAAPPAAVKALRRWSTLFLTNWETDKNVYGNGLFTVKLGHSLITGSTLILRLVARDAGNGILARSARCACWQRDCRTDLWTRSAADVTFYGTLVH